MSTTHPHQPTTSARRAGLTACVLVLAALGGGTATASPVCVCLGSPGPTVTERAPEPSVDARAGQLASAGTAVGNPQVKSCTASPRARDEAPPRRSQAFPLEAV